MIVQPDALYGHLAALASSMPPRNQGDRGMSGFMDFCNRDESNVFDVVGDFNLPGFLREGRESPHRFQPVFFGDFSSCSPHNNKTMGLFLMTALRRQHEHLIGEESTEWTRFVRNYAGAKRAPRRDLDYEAYAMDVGEAARCLANFATSTTDFLNAFVRDFEATGLRGSVFIFAFEDMHLNPSAHRAIREAIRGMAHPRLAFVFATSPTVNPEIEAFGEGLRAGMRGDPPPTPKPPLLPHARILLGDDEFT